MKGFISYILLIFLYCAVPVPLALWFTKLGMAFAEHIKFEVYIYDPLYLQMLAGIYFITPFLAGIVLGLYLIFPIVNRLPDGET